LATYLDFGRERPGDRRGIVHDTAFGRAIGDFISGRKARTSGGSRGPINIAACPVGTRRTSLGTCVRDVACPPGERKTSAGNCVRIITATITPSAFLPGGEKLLTFGPEGGAFGPSRGVPGNAVMGRYGAGLEPTLETRTTRDCLPGMVLGNDGICYNRRDVPNKSRMWPKGRKPLLTGGEMNAITTAARAARRVKSTTKKLQSLGLLDKPKTRRPAPKQIGPGGPSHHHHE